MNLGHFLSICDRIGGYSLGDFSKAMEMAKMNAHASGWHPALIVRRSVSFFEDMLNNESDMCEQVLNGIPKHMRKNFLDNIVSFMKLRQEEIQIYNKFTYEGLKLIPTIEKNTDHDEFIDALLEIYKELPKPLQFTREDFVESIHDKDTIIKNIRSLLGEAVQAKMISDVPICTLLSGGIDSVITTYLLSKLYPKLEAFVVTTEGGSDIKFARIAAKEFGIKLHEIHMTNDEIMNSIALMTFD